MKLKFHLRLIENSFTRQVTKKINEISPNNKYATEIIASKKNVKLKSWQLKQ